MLTLTSATATNAGRKRKNNEDCVLAVPSSRLWIVADGMGGHSCGEVASQMAVDRIAEYYAKVILSPDATSPIGLLKFPDMDLVLLDAAMRWANHEIWELAQSDPRFSDGGLTQMGTTVVVLHQAENGDAVIGHLGDSRCYLLRGGTLTPLTEDHSLVNEMARMLRVPVAEVNAPRNVITRACGLKEKVETTTVRHDMQPGDVFLLCSDGLTGELSDSDIEQTLGSWDPLQDIADSLVDQAVQHGGKDNVSVAIIRVG